MILVDQGTFKKLTKNPFYQSKVFSFLISRQYNVKLIIPDINCPRCSLQLVNPMTDKINRGSCCPYPTGTNNCQSVYHSCANIVITGKIPVEEYVHNYHGPCGNQLFKY
jgi:hypothetical protein